MYTILTLAKPENKFFRVFIKRMGVIKSAGGTGDNHLKEILDFIRTLFESPKFLFDGLSPHF